MTEESYMAQLGIGPDVEQNLDPINKLTNLGNQAVSLGLILGHGYHNGKYEILHAGEALLFSEEEGQIYLEQLISEKA
jgi:hypothetical protein